MSPRWGFRRFGPLVFYTHAAPLGLCGLIQLRYSLVGNYGVTICIIPFLKDYIALAVLRKYENEVSFAIADFGYFPRISLNCCCIWSNV